MVIGVDGSRAFVEGRTGTENYSYQLIKNMSLIDTENRYLIYTRKGQGTRVKGQGWPENFKFVEINFPGLWTQVGLALRTFIDPLDVLFIPSHTLPLIRRPGLKTVITVHDLGAEYLPGFHQLKQVLYLKLMTHYQIKTATKIISVSKATRNDLVRKIGVNSRQIEVVYEGVDRSIFKKLSNDIVKDILLRYKLENKRYFLFVGTIQPRKNLERLIKAFDCFLKNSEKLRTPENQKFSKPEESVLSDVSGKSDSTGSLSRSDFHRKSGLFSEKDRVNFKLVLVGSKGWKSDGIYKLPAELGIEENVHFPGRVGDEDLVGLYNGALGLTYPSLFEGFGLPILEAFACSCPVITSNTSSMPEVAKDAAILVNPDSENEISNAMLSLYRNDIERLSLINKGILRLRNFDWKLAARQTIDILERTGIK